jgi:tRNA/tmRNA/rRNA uracil-C5-methylase (TrmA/RlmC/RlmD family)
VKRSVGIDEDEHMNHAAMQNAEVNGITNAYFVNGSCDQILIDIAQHVTANERMVCFFDLANPAPPTKTIETVTQCKKVKMLVLVCESAYSFEYDCETKLCHGKGFRLCTVELFDCGPFSTVTKILAVFEREIDSEGA